MAGFGPGPGTVRSQLRSPGALPRARGRERPLLENGDRREILESLLEIRDPLYREVADLVVETDGRKVHSVAEEIIGNLS